MTTGHSLEFVIARSRTDRADLELEEILDEGTPESSSRFFPIQVKANDGRTYWVKTQTYNPEKAHYLVAAQVAARAGRLIGAPTCEAKTIRIGPSFHGRPLASGDVLSEQVAHASLQVEGSRPVDVLDRRYLSVGDNRFHYLALMAHFHWCLGADRDQWLFVESPTPRYVSHDHDLYLDTPNWTNPTRLKLTDQANADRREVFTWEHGDLKQADGKRILEALDAVTPQDVAAVLGSVPSSWHVSNEMLAEIGECLLARRRATAAHVKRWSGIPLTFEEQDDFDLYE